MKQHKGQAKWAITLTVAVALLVSTMVAGCAKTPPPEAGLSANLSSGAAPLAVQFTDNSTGEITDWAWDFGDGNTSTQQNPSHTYETWGNYTVSLKVIGPGGSDTETRTDYIEVTEEEKTVITIGMITDLTGPASKAGEAISKGLEDWFRYINEEDPIPGAELRYEIYDTRYSPGRTPLAYRWMVDKGVDIIVTLFTQDAELLKPMLARDQMPMLSASTTDIIVDPPGWVFTQSPPYEDIVETILAWISTEGWDYEAMGRKLKIGAVGWANTMGESYGAAAEAYSKDNPDKFVWVGKEIAPMGTLNWFSEVERLKDADYIISGLLGQPFATFVGEMAASGYEPKMIVNNPVGVEWRLVKDAVGVEALDGFIFADYYPVWEDENEIPRITLVKENLHKYRPDEEEHWLAEGHGFLCNTFFLAYLTGVIRQAVEQVGAENVDGKAIYEASQDFELNIEGYAPLKLTPTRRHAQTDLIFHRFDKDVGWVPISGWVNAQDLIG